MAVTISKTNSEFVENEINNVSSNIIRIIEDKLRLKLVDYEKSVAHCYDWVGAVGIIVTIALSLLTTEFKDRFNVKAETWCALFFILLIIAIGYVIYTIVKALSRKTIEEFISDLKK